MSRLFARFAVICLSFALVSCNERDENFNKVFGRDEVQGPHGEIPSSINPDGGAGSGCDNEDPDHICLAVKWVSLTDSAGTPSVSEAAAHETVEELNGVWTQCNLSFFVEKYVAADPDDYGLNYATTYSSELNGVRRAFADSTTLLVAITGTWNRYGTLGSANAWTMMPGGDPYGVVAEKPVGDNGNLIGHELGHYLNLGHVSDSYALMNPVIYGRSVNIYSSQCDTARSAAKYFWTKMIR